VSAALRPFRSGTDLGGMSLMLQPPMWVPFVWWALLAGSAIASMVGDPGVVCSIAAPCQPDAIFPMAVALVGVAAIAFWWEPMAALCAGLGYGGLSVLFDPSVPGRYAGVGNLAGSMLPRSPQVADRPAGR
jgi:hypothetical protein